MDTTQAKALPGVWDVFSYEDEDLHSNWFNYKFFSGMVVGESDSDMKYTKVGIDAQGPVADAYTKPDVANWNDQPLGIIVVAESEENCAMRP